MQWLDWQFYFLIFASSLRLEFAAGLPYPIPQSDRQDLSPTCANGNDTGTMDDHARCRTASDTKSPDTVITEYDVSDTANDRKAMTLDPADLSLGDPIKLELGKHYPHSGSKSKKILIS